MKLQEIKSWLASEPPHVQRYAGELVKMVEQLTADVDYLADRASAAGSCGGREPRDVGLSSNAIVALAYQGKPVDCLPFDKWDLAACELAIKRMPEHRKTADVLNALERARTALEVK